MNQAKFLDLSWGIDANGVKLLQNASIQKALSADEKETVEGQSPTNSKTFEAQSFEMTYTVSTAVGGDPLKEWANVQKHVGKRGAIFIGAERIGANVFMLDEGKFTAEAIAPGGHILRASYSIKFTEDSYSSQAPAASKEKYIGQSKAKATKSGLTMRDVTGGPDFQTTVSAYNIRPTRAQIAEVK